MNPTAMRLRVFLPSHIFVDRTDVRRIVAEDASGSFGLLPRRLDCVAAIVPGILTYETGGDGETHIAVDEGVLVKAGSDVLVSVRNAFGGADLGRLREAVERDFRSMDQHEQAVRSVLAKLESGFLSRFMEVHRA